MPKPMTTRNQKIITNISWKLSDTGKAPRGSQGYNPLMKNIFQTDFIISPRNLSHHFEYFLGSFSTLWPQNSVKPVRITLILNKLAWKNKTIHNKFAIPKKSQNKNQKITSNSEILVTQPNLPSHPYYAINLWRRHEKLYDSFWRSK